MNGSELNDTDWTTGKQGDNGTSRLHASWNAQEQTLKNLWPALVQCFTIIVFGYFAGRVNLLSKAQAQGLGTYLSNFALPALLFRSLALIEFDKVNWTFLLSILISKLIVFIVVAIMTLLISRPVNLAKIGIYSIFATQSNDIALGYPIIAALYPGNMEINYLYLIQPISLVILNPLGFICLEISKWRQQPRNQRSKGWVAVFNVIKGIGTNPIVFMSALGIVANFVFGRKVPVPFDNILKTLGDSFSAVALFFLGHNMLGKFSSMNGRTLMTALLLIAAKMLLMPFLTRELTTCILRASGQTQDIVRLSSFAFFYGTFPTAPVVFLFSNQYRVAQAVISTSVVLSTFLALPLMFLSAEMVMLRVAKEVDFDRLLNNTAFDVSWVTIISCIWVIFVFIVSRRLRSIPHQFTLCLAFCQILCVTTLMLLIKIPPAYDSWAELIMFSLHLIGAYGCHSWVTMIAVAISFTRIWSLCYVLKYKPLYFIYGFGFPVFSVGVILMTHTLSRTDTVSRSGDHMLAWGNVQVIVTIIYILINIILSIGALVCQHRHDKSYLGSRSRRDSENEAGASVTSETTQPMEVYVQNRSRNEQPASPNLYNSYESHPSGSYMSRSFPRSRVHKRVRIKATKRQCDTCQQCGPSGGGGDIEDLEHLCTHQRDVTHEEMSRSTHEEMSRSTSEPATNSTPLLANVDVPNYATIEQDVIAPDMNEMLCNQDRYTCDVQECTCMIEQYMSARFYGMDHEEITAVTSRDEHQVLRHVVLVILLLLVQFAILFLSLWRVTPEDYTGLYIELEFFNAVLIAGQGLFLLGLFGFDSALKDYPVYKRIREQVKSGEVTLPEIHELTEHTLSTCDIFVTHHLKQCKNDVIDCYWHRLRRYSCAFQGKDLVDWLLEYGMCEERSECQQYGAMLLQGRVIAHVQRAHLFYDLPYLYEFIVEGKDDDITNYPAITS